MRVRPGCSPRGRRPGWPARRRTTTWSRGSPATTSRTGSPGCPARPPRRRWAGRCRCCGSAHRRACARCCRWPATRAVCPVRDRSRPRPSSAGEAVVGRGLGLVPRITEHGSAADRTCSVLWTAYEVAEPAPDPLTVPEAEHDLTAATRDAASALAALDVASWRPEVAGELARMRRGVTPELPPGHEGGRSGCWRSADRLAAGAGPGPGRLPGRRGHRRRGPRPATTRCVHWRPRSAGPGWPPTTPYPPAAADRPGSPGDRRPRRRSGAAVKTPGTAQGRRRGAGQQSSGQTSWLGPIGPSASLGAPAVRSSTSCRTIRTNRGSVPTVAARA